MSGVPPVARFSLNDLVESSGVSRRTIRYYIDQGLVSAPEGKGRSAYYTPRHVEELERAKSLRDAGYALAEIRETRDPPAPTGGNGDLWERFTLHPALELHRRTDAPPYVQELVNRFMVEAEHWFGASDAHDEDVD